MASDKKLQDLRRQLNSRRKEAAEASQQASLACLSEAKDLFNSVLNQHDLDTLEQAIALRVEARYHIAIATEYWRLST